MAGEGGQRSEVRRQESKDMKKCEGMAGVAVSSVMTVETGVVGG